MAYQNDINKGISCDVSGCVFNEHGCNCNLDKVSISKGSGLNHYCKSYIPLNDENEYKKPLSSIDNVESGDEYFNFGELMKDIEKDNLPK